MKKTANRKSNKAPKPLTDAEKLQAQLNDWQEDPSDYWNKVLGYNRLWEKKGDLDNLKPGEKAIWWLQKKMIEACPRAIKEHKAIYVGTGHSLSKDHTFGGVANWFLDVYRPSVVILTAPTGRQVHDIAWKETRMHRQEKIIDLGGRIFTEPRIEIEPDWYLIGFATKDTGASKEAGGSKFQGFKGKKNICVIVTEAQGVEDSIRDQIDAVASGAENFLLVFLGNPTKAKGWFAKGLKDPRNNIVIQESCLNGPNYIERKTVIPGGVTYFWVEQRRDRWNADNTNTDPRWVGRVLGQIPDQALNTIFDDKIIAHAKTRFGFIAKHSYNRGVAWDPAGEGVDDHVFTAGADGEIMDKFKKTLMSPTEGAIQAVEMCKRIFGSWIVVDCDGSGARDFAALKALPKDYLGNIQPLAFYGSAKPNEISTIQAGGNEITKTMYANNRAAAAFITRDRILAGKASINPNDKELIEDLQEDAWIPDKTPLQIIPKDEIKEVLGRSPGDGDSFKMLNWACEQNLKQISYSGESPLPQYANTEQDLHRDANRLPKYGNTQ